VLKANIQKLHK
jgi:hypothetical protein